MDLTEWEQDLLDMNLPVHVDYPHWPGTLHGCPECEDECACDDDYTCIACIKNGEEL